MKWNNFLSASYYEKERRQHESNPGRPSHKPTLLITGPPSTMLLRVLKDKKYCLVFFNGLKDHVAVAEKKMNRNFVLLDEPDDDHAFGAAVEEVVLVHVWKKKFNMILEVKRFFHLLLATRFPSSCRSFSLSFLLQTGFHWLEPGSQVNSTTDHFYLLFIQWSTHAEGWASRIISQRDWWLIKYPRAQRGLSTLNSGLVSWTRKSERGIDRICFCQKIQEGRRKKGRSSSEW